MKKKVHDFNKRNVYLTANWDEKKKGKRNRDGQKLK